MSWNKNKIFSVTIVKLSSKTSYRPNVEATFYQNLKSITFVLSMVERRIIIKTYLVQ